MPVIDITMMEQLADRYADGYSVSPDQIGKCVRLTRFDPSNKRTEIIKEVKSLIKTYNDRDEKWSEFYKKYKYLCE